MAEIDQALVERAAVAPAAMLDVIVTLSTSLSDDRLAAAGLAITNRFERLNTVSGRIKAASLDRLATLPGVARIEADSDMRAL
jgi:hypothetical protein